MGWCYKYLKNLNGIYYFYSTPSGISEYSLTIKFSPIFFSFLLWRFTASLIYKKNCSSFFTPHPLPTLIPPQLMGNSPSGAGNILYKEIYQRIQILLNLSPTRSLSMYTVNSQLNL